MPDPASGVISKAMSASGAPTLPTPMGVHSLRYGISCEENRMHPTHVGPVEVPCCMVGMVVSPDALQWHWKQAGRPHMAHIGPGNLLTLPAGPVPEQWWLDPVSILTVSFAPERIAPAIGEAAAGSLAHLRPSPIGTQPVISHLFWALHACITSSLPHNPLVLEGIGVALAAAVAGHFTAVPATVLDPGKGLDFACLRRVTEFIEEHLSEGLHLGDLAKVAHMSQFHFSRSFKRTTGQGVHRFILQRRITRARFLLAGSSLSLPEIALRVGLPNHGHFTTVFRQQVGSTPGQYRRECRR